MSDAWRTVIIIDGLKIGDGNLAVIVNLSEDEEGVLDKALSAKQAGADMLRCGRYYEEEIIEEIKAATGLPLIIEVTEIKDIDAFYNYASVFWIGSKNMGNLSLLWEAKISYNPVMIERDLSVASERWLKKIEDIFGQRHPEVILCEPGEYLTSGESTPDQLSQIRQDSGLPLIVDFSQAESPESLVSAIGAMGLDGAVLGLNSLTPRFDLAVNF